MNKMIKTEQITHYDETDFEQLKRLISQLTKRVTPTNEMLMQTLKEGALFVARDDRKIIGCAIIVFFHSLTGRKASIEDVVVDETYRGKGIGRQLMENVLALAKTKAPVTLQLTSRAQRIAANALYASMGFERKNTNFYTLAYDKEE